MLNKDTINFLSDLAVNNNKDWFHANKERYDAIKHDFISFVNELINEINGFDKSIGNPDPKKCIFRINRDVRFSKDKSPYKINLGAEITPGGKRSLYAGYYLHIEPENSFVGGGLYMPESRILKAIRSDLVLNPKKINNLIENDTFKKRYDSLQEIDKLSNPPRGYNHNSPNIELLKNKHFVASKSYSQEEVMNIDFKDNIIKDFKALHPLNAYFNQIIKKEAS